MILLTGLPIPPIANHRLTPMNGRLIKSKDCREYNKSIQIWMLRQKSNLFEWRRIAKNWIDVGYLLKVSMTFTFPKEKVLSKNNLPLRLDLDGRIKEQIDSMSDIIGIDDKFVIEINAYKKYWLKSWGEVQVTVEPIFWSDSNDST